MSKSVNTALLLLTAATLALPSSANFLFAKSMENLTSEDAWGTQVAEDKANLRGQASASPTLLLEDEVRDDLGVLNTSDLPNLGKKENQVLEDQVSDLFKMAALRKTMTKEAFDATPMGSSVKKIYHIIENVMMPKVLEAHKSNQDELNKLAKEVSKCGTTKDTQVGKANLIKAKYVKFSPMHKTCRAGEAGVLTEKNACWEEEADKKKIRDLKCKTFSMVSKQVGDQQAGRQIMKKGGSESTESYVNRISSTVCGNCVGKGCKLGFDRQGSDKCGYEPYSCGCGFRCKFDKAKDDCDAATKDWHIHNKKCKAIDKQYSDKKNECNSLQDQMDDSACKRAVQMKDACETYAECYMDKKAAFLSLEKMVKSEEKDRKAEWRGLKRMRCLIEAFAGGKVTDGEINKCKGKTHTTDHLIIKYPKLVAMVKCEVPHMYPNTPTYKKENFAPLPTLAKGKPDSYECTGVQEISTTPAKGSPKTCRCSRITLNGPYSPGPVVKCVNCRDVRRSLDKNSCPDGTKLFSPRSRTDWKTFLASATPLRAPSWIIDITRPKNHCGGCKSPMHSKNVAQRSWTTSDGSAWWLRSTGYKEPNGDYQANCYLDLGRTPFTSPDRVTFNDHSCNYHSKSYYCQAAEVNLTPKKGSPNGCQCKLITLTGKYSAGSLMKCTGCLKVSRSMQKNSCPDGTKLFSPRSREDWKTFITSAAELRSPNWIIDITQGQNGCGGCTKSAMNSGSPAQATWRTSDGSPWFLRSSRYTEPNGDYHANCYMDLNKAESEDSITFNDANCKYSSNAYYCQTAEKKKKEAPPEDDDEPEGPPPLGPPPTPKPGGHYKGFKCIAGAYTGKDAKCGHFTGLTEKQCVEKCAKSESAMGKDTCDKVHGVPDCVASVYDKEKKTCILHRACNKLVEWEGHRDSVTTIKAIYDPAALTFERLANIRCKSKPYTKKGARLTGVNELQCKMACFNNQYVKGAPLKKCAASVYYKKKKYCDLYESCEKTRRKSGYVTFRKLSTAAFVEGFPRALENCNCGKRIAQWPNKGKTKGKYDTLQKCAAQCKGNKGCKSFGLWPHSSKDAGYCALFNEKCGQKCQKPTATKKGWFNNVFNKEVPEKKEPPKVEKKKKKKDDDDEDDEDEE